MRGDQKGTRLFTIDPAKTGIDHFGHGLTTTHLNGTRGIIADIVFCDRDADTHADTDRTGTKCQRSCKHGRIDFGLGVRGHRDRIPIGVPGSGGGVCATDRGHGIAVGRVDRVRTSPCQSHSDQPAADRNRGCEGHRANGGPCARDGAIVVAQNPLRPGFGIHQGPSLAFIDDGQAQVVGDGFTGIAQGVAQSAEQDLIMSDICQDGSLVFTGTRGFGAGGIIKLGGRDASRSHFGENIARDGPNADPITRSAGHKTAVFNNRLDIIGHFIGRDGHADGDPHTHGTGGSCQGHGPGQ